SDTADNTDTKISSYAATASDASTLSYGTPIVGRLCQLRKLLEFTEWSRGAASVIDGRLVRAKERERVSQTPYNSVSQPLLEISECCSPPLGNSYRLSHARVALPPAFVKATAGKLDGIFTC